MNYYDIDGKPVSLDTLCRSEGEERCDKPWPCPMHGGVAR